MYIKSAYIYIYISPLFLDSFPVQTIAEYWVKFPVLYSGFLLVIYFIARYIFPSHVTENQPEKACGKKVEFVVSSLKLGWGQGGSVHLSHMTSELGRVDLKGKWRCCYQKEEDTGWGK